MVCSTAILTSSLALSLLRHSAPPSQSFVLSPFSLNTALSIVHDGASGVTQQELTDLLLNGCSPSDVTAFYSSLARSLPSTNETGVAFNSANRFYVDDSISLKTDYQMLIEDKYKVKVENIDLGNKEESAKEINKFIDESTDGKIKDIIKADGISENAKAMLVNAIYFQGKWKYTFNKDSTRSGNFNGNDGQREIEFMSKRKKPFRFNSDNDIGTLLLLPYLDEEYNFFYLMPKESSNLETMRNKLTGDKLLNIIKNATKNIYHISVPKFKVESNLDGVELLSKLGVKSVFNDAADLSKISSSHLKVSKITHDAVIETDEDGTEAAAVTVIEIVLRAGGRPYIRIDRPFLFGILRNENVIFIGQFV